MCFCWPGRREHRIWSSGGGCFGNERTSVWCLSTVASGTESEWSETETCPYQTPSAQSKGSHPVRDHIKIVGRGFTLLQVISCRGCGFTTRQKPRERWRWTCPFSHKPDETGNLSNRRSHRCSGKQSSVSKLLVHEEWSWFGSRNPFNPFRGSWR